MKDFSIVFSPFSLEDAEQAVAYYEEQQAGLGKKFALNLQLILNAIKRNPYYTSIRYEDIRCAGIKRFPFLVHYHINEESFQVTIIAVYSTHQEPLGE